MRFVRSNVRLLSLASIPFLWGQVSVGVLVLMMEAFLLDAPGQTANGAEEWGGAILVLHLELSLPMTAALVVAALARSRSLYLVTMGVALILWAVGVSVSVVGMVLRVS